MDRRSGRRARRGAVDRVGQASGRYSGLGQVIKCVTMDSTGFRFQPGDLITRFRIPDRT